MRHLFLLVPLAVCSTLSAQDPEAVTARQRYEEAYWSEIGQGDPTAALQTYLAAAETEGEATYRAKALLRAAEIQHRLGQNAEAMTTIASVIERFPAETDVVALARALRSEWQEIDLRRNYSDWYQRQLFTPEVQAEVLALVKEYAGYPEPARRPRSKEDREAAKKLQAKLDTMQRQILTYGVGAVPALEQLARTAATAQDRILAERTCGLMLRLGTVPPADALLLESSWAERSASWRTLIRTDAATRSELARTCSGRSGPLALALTSLGRGEMALVDLLAGDRGGEIAAEDDDIAFALMEALHAFGDDQVHGAVVELSRKPGVPHAVKRIAERVVAEGGWRGADAAQWYEWSHGRTELQTRFSAVYQACRSLRAGDQELLRKLITDQKELEPYALYSYHEALTEGLSRNPVPMQLPWTTDLVHELLMSIPGETGQGYGLGRYRTTDAGRAMLAEALLQDPVELVRRRRDEGIQPFLLYQDYYPDEEYEIWRISDAWAAEIARQITARWEQWSGEERAAVLELLVDEEGNVPLLSTDRPFPRDLRGFLEKQAATGAQGEQVKSALQRIDEVWEQE